MSIGRAGAALLLATVASLLLAAVIASIRSAAEETELEGNGRLIVDWDFRPDDVDELTARSQAAVVAQVTAVRAGEPLAVEGVDGASLPTQRIDFEVTSRIAGEIPEQFTLFKNGDFSAQAEGDPPYEAGSRYLLFVRRRLAPDSGQPDPDGSWIATAPDGRLERESSGELDAKIDGSVAEQLDGETVAEAREEIDPDLIGEEAQP